MDVIAQDACTGLEKLIACPADTTVAGLRTAVADAFCYSMPDALILQCEGREMCAFEDGHPLRLAECCAFRTGGVVQAYVQTTYYEGALASGEMSLADAPEWIRQDRTCVAISLHRSGMQLRFASAELRSDPDVVLDALRSSPSAVRYAAPALLASRPFALRALACSAPFACLHPSLHTDRTVVLAALQGPGAGVFSLPQELWGDREVVYAFALKHGMRDVPPQARADRGIALEVARRGATLSQLDERLRNDVEIARAALQWGMNDIALAGPAVRDDKPAVLSVVRERGRLLRYASPRLCNDKEVVMAAAGSCSEALEYASPSLRSDSDVARIASRGCGTPPQYSACEPPAKAGSLRMRVAAGAASLLCMVLSTYTLSS